MGITPPPLSPPSLSPPPLPSPPPPPAPPLFYGWPLSISLSAGVSVSNCLGDMVRHWLVERQIWALPPPLSPPSTYPSWTLSVNLRAGVSVSNCLGDLMVRYLCLERQVWGLPPPLFPPPQLTTPSPLPPSTVDYLPLASVLVSVSATATVTSWWGVDLESDRYGHYLLPSSPPPPPPPPSTVTTFR